MMEFAQGNFVGALEAVEERLEMEGRPLKGPLSEVITSDTSTIFYLMKEHG